MAREKRFTILREEKPKRKPVDNTAKSGKRLTPKDIDVINKLMKEGAETTNAEIRTYLIEKKKLKESTVERALSYRIKLLQNPGRLLTVADLQDTV